MINNQQDKNYYLAICFNIILYIIFWILAGLNFNNPDYSGYKYDYDNGLLIFEPLYNSLFLLSKYFNLSYSEFVAIISVISLAFFVNSINKYVTQHYIVLTCFAISPLGLLITQIRSFLVYSIFYNILNYFFINISKKKIKITNFFYLSFTWFLCINIHHSIALYLIFSAFVFIKPKQILKIMLFVWLLLICFDLESLINLASNVIPATKALLYIKANLKPNINGLMNTYLLYSLGLLSAIMVVYAEYINKRYNCPVKENFNAYLNNSISINSLFLRFYLPIGFMLLFVRYNTIFERFYFYLYPYIYMLLIKQFNCSCSRIQKQNLIIIIIILVLYAFFYLSYVCGGLTRIIIPILTDNYIWNGLKFLQ